MEQRAASAIVTARSGFSLVEMLVAILLTAIIVTATFSALLLTKADLGGSDNQMTVSQAQQQLLRTLQNYQAASISGNDVNSGPNQTGLCGSGSANTWCLTKPYESGVACSGSNCLSSSLCSSNVCAGNSYALAIGCGHNVTAWLPATLQAAPFNGVMCYTVTDQSGSSPYAQSQFIPQVNVTVQWTKQTP
jgi:prepilin-type N-terminal cleavage/methylation domain-containing protein